MADVPIRITEHAEWQLERRELDRERVLDVVRAPESVVDVRPGREIRRSLTPDGRYLIRVVVDVTDDEVAIVTMYKTSKIGRYRR